jgi:AraC family transcriptional regulator
MSIHFFSGQNLSRARAAWPGVSLQVNRSRIGSRAEAVLHMPRHTLHVTLGGGTRRTVVRVDGGDDYDGADVPGVVSFVPAGRRHHGWYAGGWFEVATLQLDPSTVGSIVGNAIDPDAIEFVPAVNRRDLLVHQLALSLKDEMATGGVLGELFVETLVATLAAHLVREYSNLAPQRGAIPPGLAANRLRRVLDYINDNLGADIRLVMLATLADVSPDHLGRAFKQAIGLSPHRYVTERRLERAKELLTTSNRPLSEIAYGLGFSSQSHFTTVFRRFLGVTPRAYRDHHGTPRRRQASARGHEDESTSEF